jgi:hypothetical protein
MSIMGWLAALGGALLALALLMSLLELARRAWWPAWQRSWQARKRRRAMARMDWRLVEGGQPGARQGRDCEKEATLGVCTGLECYFWDSCKFNIKKPLRRS